MNIRLLYGTKDVSPLGSEQTQNLRLSTQFSRGTTKKPCAKSVFHCSCVLILGVMKNSKNMMFGCELHPYQLSYKRQEFQPGISCMFCIPMGLRPFALQSIENIHDSLQPHRPRNCKVLNLLGYQITTKCGVAASNFRSCLLFPRRSAPLRKKLADPYLSNH